MPEWVVLHIQGIDSHLETQVELHHSSGSDETKAHTWLANLDRLQTKYTEITWVCVCVGVCVCVFVCVCVCLA